MNLGDMMLREIYQPQSPNPARRRLHEIPGVAKFIETGSRLAGARAWGREDGAGRGGVSV